MAEIQNVLIDGYGNRLYLNAEEVGTDNVNNTSTVHVWLDISVVGHVASANIRVNTTGGTESNLGYQYWGPGAYRIKESYFVHQHNPDGTGAVRVEGYFHSSIGNWDLSGTLPLTNLKRPSVINSFTGDNVKGNFKATYTPVCTGIENRLRISIPSVKALDTFSNYVSGQEVQLSDTSIEYIKNYTNKNTITLGGVIETWVGSTKIGESTEINIQCTVSKGNKIRINGQWKEAIPYVGVNGQWKEAISYVGVNGQWKEGI